MLNSEAQVRSPKFNDSLEDAPAGVADGVLDLRNTGGADEKMVVRRTVSTGATQITRY
jgi:hypothetical protein